MNHLWAVYVVDESGWTELEAMAIFRCTDAYRLALELGYGLVDVAASPRIADEKTVSTRVEEGWSLAPLQAWWSTYEAAREGKELPDRWPPFPAWMGMERYRPASSGQTDRHRVDGFRWSVFSEGDQVVAERGEPPDLAEEDGLACRVCGITAAARPGRDEEAGLDQHQLRYGWEWFCGPCWRDSWRDLHLAANAEELGVAIAQIRQDDSRQWWWWSWDDSIFIASEEGREKWRIWYRRGYLRSVAWRAQRERLRLRADNCCEWCGESASKVGWLEGHHLTYDRVGHEDLDDLVLLCDGCHARAHGEKEPPAPTTTSEHAARYYQLGRRRAARRTKRAA